MGKTAVVALLGLIGSLPLAAPAADFLPFLYITNMSHSLAEVEVDGGNFCLLNGAVTKDGSDSYYECYYTPDMQTCNAMPLTGADYTCVKMDLSKPDHTVVVTVNGKKLPAKARLIYHQPPPSEPGEEPQGYYEAHCAIEQGSGDTITLKCG